MSRSISRRFRDLSAQFVRRLATESPREARAFVAACRPVEQLETRRLFAGVFEITPTTVNVAEFNSATSSATSVQLTITRTVDTTAPETVDVVLAPGVGLGVAPARAGADYTDVGATVNFSAGQTTANITVPIINDGLYELTEEFTVSIANPSGGATLGPRSTTTISILDDDTVQTATLVTGGLPAQDSDGALTITVDPFGGFGRRYAASGAVFNAPGGNYDAKESVDASGLFFGPLGGFLSIDQRLFGSPLSLFLDPNNFQFSSQTPTSAVSEFTIPATAFDPALGTTVPVTTDGNSYRIKLTQTLNGYDVSKARTTLVQTYEVTNLGPNPATNLVLNRFLGSYENWGGSVLLSDHGGRSGDGRILYAFDTKAGDTPYVSIRNDDVEFVDNIVPAYTVQQDDIGALLPGAGYESSILAAGGIPAPDLYTMPADTDTTPDRLDNTATNSGFAQTLVIQDTYGTIPAGGTLRYVTRTDFGGLNDDFGGFLHPGVFSIEPTASVAEPVGDPARGATGVPVTITIRRGTGSRGAADIGIVSRDVEAVAFTNSGLPGDYVPLGQVDPLTGAPTPYTSVHFQDGETEKQIILIVNPDLAIEGLERIFVGMYRPTQLVPSVTPTGSVVTDPVTGFPITHTIGIQPLGDPVENDSPFPTFWDVGQLRQGDPTGPIQFINVAILPNDSPGTVGFTTTATQVNEADGTGLLRVTIARLTPDDASAEINFTYSFDPASTATQGADYLFPAGFDPVTGIGTGRIGIGQLSATIDIPLINDSVVETAEALILNLVSAAPAGLVAPNKINVTITDDDQTGQFRLDSSTYSTAEGVAGGTLAVTVSRNGGTDTAVTIPFNLSGGTAIPGVDYTDVTQSLSFGIGESSKVVLIPILNDSIPEVAKTFNVSLGNPSIGTLGTPSTAVVTLTDDDVTGRVSIAVTGVTVRENAGTVRLTLTRTFADNSIVTADFATADGTAHLGSDYVATSGTVTFGPNEDTAFIDIPILDDSIVESAESFTVSLSNITGLAQFGAAVNATVTISDNDATVQFAPTSYTVNEGAGTVSLTVTRAGDLTGSASVAFATADGTAVAGRDYTATSGILTFLPGEASKTISVPVTDHFDVTDPTRSFSVNLSNPSGEGVTLGADTAATVSVTDIDRASPFITDLQVVIPSSGIERIVLSFSRPLDPASANSVANYSLVSGDKKGRLNKFVRVSSATYNPANNTVTLVPSPRLKSNTLYQVLVRSSNGVRSTSGLPLARAANGQASDFVARFGFGNKLNYRDRNGALVNLKLAKRGSFMYTAGVDTATEETLTLFNTQRGRSTLTGNVKGGTRARFETISGAADTNIRLSPSQFQIDEVIA